MNNHDANTVLDVRQFLGGYLKQEDLHGETLVTIAAAEPEVLEGETRQKLVIRCAEFQKPLILNSTNIRDLATMFREPDAKKWVGQQAILYVDPSVVFAGKRTGGIRVKPAMTNGATKSQQPNAYDAEFDGIL